MVNKSSFKLKLHGDNGLPNSPKVMVLKLKIKNKLGNVVLGESIWAVFQKKEMSSFTLRFTDSKIEDEYDNHFLEKTLENMRLSAVFGVLILSLESVYYYFNEIYSIFLYGTILRGIASALLIVLGLSSLMKMKNGFRIWTTRIISGLIMICLFMGVIFVHDYISGAKIMTFPCWILLLFAMQGIGCLSFLELFWLNFIVFVLHVVVYAIWISDFWNRDFINPYLSYIAICIAGLLANYSREIYIRRKFYIMHNKQSNNSKDMKGKGYGQMKDSFAKSIPSKELIRQPPMIMKTNEITVEGPVVKECCLSRFRRFIFLEYKNDVQEKQFQAYYNQKAIQTSNRQFFIQICTDLAIVLSSVRVSEELDKHLIMRAVIPPAIFFVSWGIGKINRFAKFPLFIQIRNISVVIIISLGYVFQIGAILQTVKNPAKEHNYLFFVLVSQYVSLNLTATGSFNLRVKFIVLLSIILIFGDLIIQYTVFNESAESYFIIDAILSHFVAILSSWLFEKEVRNLYQLKQNSTTA